MFGWINDCTECLVVSKFGEEAWHQIKDKADCKVDDGGFLRYKYYADADTVQLVVAASEILGLTVDEVLFAFGDYFVDYVKDNGYANVLECLGSNLRDWLSNLNSLHDHLQASYPKGFVAPVFWSEDDELSPDGADSTAILVHYYSKRGSLLVPLVVGLLKKVARVYFDIEINLDQLQLQDEATGTDHTSWRVTPVDPKEAHKLRGRKRTKNHKRRVSHSSTNGAYEQQQGQDDETIKTDATTAKTSYTKSFLEGEAQAANLRVEEFVKRSFYNEDCELFHALTLEQFLYLADEWKTNQVGDQWCYQIWSIQDGDSSSWPSLADLPAKLNPATISPIHFGGHVPSTGRFPPDEKGILQSFAPKIRLVKKDDDSKSLEMVLDKSSQLTLEDAILNASAVEDAGLKSFPDVQDRVDSGEYVIQCIVWQEETQSAYHTFALTDLKTTTTVQLFELVPESFDPIVLMFQCVEKIAVEEDEEDI
jgi:hypothetical protein